jgi:hypothetical protein
MVLAAAVLWSLAAPAPAFIVINEIMYHPAKSAGDLEFVELLNDSPTTEEIAGWRFTSGIEHTFPSGTSIPAHGLLVVAANPEAIRRACKITNVVGPLKSKLGNKGAVIELRNNAGGLVDRVDYKDDPPWPAGADGTGHSLSLIDPLSENEHGVSWALSNEPGGTPGRENFPTGPRRPTVLINEVLGESSKETWVELYNPTTGTIDLSDCMLTDDPDVPGKFAIPKGTAIKPGGFCTFTQKQMGFALSPKGRKVFLFAPRGQFVLDATAYRRTAPDQSMGRWPDGAAAWHRMTHPTADAANTVTLSTDVVINEIMYHPFSERPEDEYVEIYNRGRSPVDLAGWSFTKGIEFDFPPGTILQADGYLVAAKNSQALKAKYGIANCIGDYRKRLSRGGERLVLRDALGNVADEVAYCDGGRWPRWADGGGSSLELIDPRQDNAYPSAWAASDESAKAQWSHIEYSKANGKGNSVFQMFLLDRGAVLVDDLELRRGTRNYIRNGTFDKGTDVWTIGGTHKYSSQYTADSHSGGACLRVWSIGGGSTGINSLRTVTSGTLETTPTYTVSYWAKWVAGDNHLLTRTHGGGLTQTTAIPVPELIGTPGRRNSRCQENLGPIIADVCHRPVTPTSTTPVTVYARILDADGVASATVYSRPDGATTWTATALQVNSSLIAQHSGLSTQDSAPIAQHSALFTHRAALPVQSGGSGVAFYVRATDTRGASLTFPNDAPRRTCFYRVRDAGWKPTRLKSFDILMTSATANRLLSRAYSEERMDNEPLDATLVMNDSRAFYNVGIRYLGSVWIRPARGRVLWFTPPVRRPGFHIRLNSDDRLFGLKMVNFDSQSMDLTCLHERMFMWLAARVGGICYNAREYIMVAQNGRREGIYELVQTIDRRFIEDYFPDAADGDLYEVNDSFEWSGSSFTGTHTRYQYVGTDRERYRFNFEKRSHEKADDFSSLIELLRMLDPKQTNDKDFEAAVEATLDLNQWLRYIAIVAAASDWDSIGFVTGKNVFLYRPPDTGRWILIPWDKDLAWGSARMAAINPDAGGITRLLSWPRYKRIYFSNIEQLFVGPLTHKEFDPVADSIHAMFDAEGESFSETKVMKAFLDSRRKYLFGNILPKADGLEITTRGGKDFDTTAGAITLEGTAALCLRAMELNGQPVPVQWTDAAAWRMDDLPLKEGPNRFVLVARPMPDGRDTSRTITITRR